MPGRGRSCPEVRPSLPDFSVSYYLTPPTLSLHRSLSSSAALPLHPLLYCITTFHAARARLPLPIYILSASSCLSSLHASRRERRTVPCSQSYHIISALALALALASVARWRGALCAMRVCCCAQMSGREDSVRQPPRCMACTEALRSSSDLVETRRGRVGGEGRSECLAGASRIRTLSWRTTRQLLPSVGGERASQLLPLEGELRSSIPFLNDLATGQQGTTLAKKRLYAKQVITPGSTRQTTNPR